MLVAALDNQCFVSSLHKSLIQKHKKCLHKVMQKYRNFPLDGTTLHKNYFPPHVSFIPMCIEIYIFSCFFYVVAFKGLKTVVFAPLPRSSQIRAKSNLRYLRTNFRQNRPNSVDLEREVPVCVPNKRKRLLD